ncbi:MAG: hypothetical protein JSR98_16780, partial [Proteobacteria bacterium]|nr:hypothetical protein [Pseudomonadota bacterium]
GRRYELPPAEAIAEANRWLARIEALLRRPVSAARPAAVARPAPPARAPTIEDDEPEAPPTRADTSLTPLFARLAHEDDDAPPPQAHAHDNDEDDEHELPPWEDVEHAEDDEDDEEEEEDEIRSLRL